MLWTKQFWTLLLSDFMIGFFMVPLVPILLEYACETSFPVGESTITGFMIGTGHLYSGLLGIINSVTMPNSC